MGDQRHEAQCRHQIGVDKFMWGSDYPHLEGTWPNTMKALTETFYDFEEGELRDILGRNAVRVYGFDEGVLARAETREVGRQDRWRQDCSHSCLPFQRATVSATISFRRIGYPASGDWPTTVPGLRPRTATRRTGLESLADRLDRWLGYGQ